MDSAPPAAEEYAYRFENIPFPRAESLEVLARVYRDARLGAVEEGIDPKIPAATFEHAKTLLASLPSDIPDPDILGEPDGKVEFEWGTSPGRTISISIGEGEVVGYATLFGKSRSYGIEDAWKALPPTLLEHIRRISVGA